MTAASTFTLANGIRCPDGWYKTRLKWSLSALDSGTRETGGGNLYDEGVFSIGGEHIGWQGELFLDSPRFISPDYYRSLKTGQIRTADVLLVKDGATIGKVALICTMPFERCAVNEHVFILRGKGSRRNTLNDNDCDDI